MSEGPLGGVHCVVFALAEEHLEVFGLGENAL